MLGFPFLLFYLFIGLHCRRPWSHVGFSLLEFIVLGGLCGGEAGRVEEPNKRPK
jgi:hypothetical protein